MNMNRLNGSKRGRKCFVVPTLLIAFSLLTGCYTQWHNDRGWRGEIEFSNSANHDNLDNFEVSPGFFDRYFYVFGIGALAWNKQDIPKVLRNSEYVELRRKDHIVNFEIVTQRGPLDIVCGFIPYVGFICGREVKVRGDVVKGSRSNRDNNDDDEDDSDDDS